MLTISFLISGLVFLGSHGKAEIIDRIVAVVNDDIITLSELERLRKSLFAREPEKDDWLAKELDLSDARRRLLDTLIEEKLIDQESKRQNVQVTEEQVEETIESLKREGGLSQIQLEMALKAEGLTYEDYAQEVTKRLRRTKLINRVVRSTIEIKEENLKAYYETHIQDYMTDESIRISHLLMSLSPNATDDEEQAAFFLAEELLEKAKKGEDFEGLAREYSRVYPGITGGDIGYFKRGELIAAIEKNAFSLTVGEVGRAIRTPQGVMLIKVTDKNKGAPIPFVEIEKQIESDFFREEMERRFREWVGKLKKRSFIDVKL
jgi:peptidyl-prolyl cis-trans isomerase SurA